MATTNGERTADATLGAQVRTARTSKGLTLRGLARALDVSPATLSQIENGRTGLTVHRLSRIADRHRRGSLRAVSMDYVALQCVPRGTNTPWPLPISAKRSSRPR